MRLPEGLIELRASRCEGAPGTFTRYSDIGVSGDMPIS